MIAENHELHCISAIFENNVYKLRLKDCDEKNSFACILNPYELVSCKYQIFGLRHFKLLEKDYKFIDIVNIDA